MHTSVNRRPLQQIIGFDWDGEDGKFYVENMAEKNLLSLYHYNWDMCIGLDPG